MDEPTKRCRACRADLPLDAFHRRRASADGRQSLCRACNIERAKRWYREHPEARSTRMDAYARERRRRHLVLVLRYLRAHPCVDCGEPDPVVLEFDHLRDKTANVSAMLKRPWARILAEIEKCDVVCANCHRRRTAARAGWFRLVEGGGGELPG